MPRGNGTGPAGMGPMTGRGAGYCAGYGVPGYANPMGGRGGGGFGYGRGMGRGMGLGLGFRGGRGQGVPYAAPVYAQPTAMPGPSPAQEVDMLKGQAEYIEETLEGIKKRIAELEVKADD